MNKLHHFANQADGKDLTYEIKAKKYDIIKAMVEHLDDNTEYEVMRNVLGKIKDITK